MVEPKLEKVDSLSLPHVHFYQGDLGGLVEKNPKGFEMPQFHTRGYKERPLLNPELMRDFLLSQDFISGCMDIWAHGVVGYDFALLFQDAAKHKTAIERIKPKELSGLRGGRNGESGDYFHDPAQHVAVLEPDDAELRISAVLVKYVPAEKKFEWVFPENIDDKTYLAVAAHVVLSFDAFPLKSYEEGSDKLSPYDGWVQKVIADVRSEIHGGDQKITLQNWWYGKPWNPNNEQDFVGIRLSPYRDMGWMQENVTRCTRLLIEEESLKAAAGIRKEWDGIERTISRLEYGEWVPDNAQREILEGVRRKVMREAREATNTEIGRMYRKELVKGIAAVEKDVDIKKMLRLL